MTDPLLPRLAVDCDGIAAALLADPAARVPHCPGWDVTALVRHHGGVQRWATGVLGGGDGSGPRPQGPEGGVEALAAWYREGAAALAEALAATPPDQPCWTFGRPPGLAWWWTRRQVLEAAVHRWDAQAALAGRADGGTGAAPDGFGAEVAVAGITEVVEDLLPRQVALGRTSRLSGPLVLRATDADRVWRIAGPAVAAADGDAAEVAGPADALLLALWRRIGTDDPALAVEGPEALVAELAATRFAP